jgi:hypothetical protein
MNHVRHGVTLLTTFVISGTLALSAVPAPVSARTFDVNESGSMILQPLGPGVACAMESLTFSGTAACAGARPHHRSGAR